jgi:type II secretory ATPase GspE/PulE/Tfp pilus assembly ATPase PilB-like protein
LELSQLGLQASDSSAANIRRGKGCESCRQNGYRGRIAIGELLPMTDAIRELVQGQANASDIRQSAIREEMKSLRDDGVRKVLLGVTTPEEVLRAAAT